MNSQSAHTSDSTAPIFLYGAILMANLDGSGLMDYAIKAAIGGAIWFVYKITSDYLSEKLKNKKEK
jgi:hypothetical protein